MDPKKQLTIAFETSIGQGSIAVLRGKDVLASELGGVTRAEDLLSAIGSILKLSDSNLNTMEKIVVSVGPGSYTGIRIGIATALGLKRGLRADIVGVPVLEALAHSTATKNIASAVPIGRGRIAVQKNYGGGPSAKAKSAYVVDSDKFAAEIHANPDTNFILPREILDEDISLDSGSPNLRFVDSNLAVLIGRYAADRSGGNLEPIYL